MLARVAISGNTALQDSSLCTLPDLRLKLMKPILCVMLFTAPFATAYSATIKNVNQLPTQSIDVQPAHLTTRIEWSKFPQPIYNNDELKGQDRSAIVRIYVNEQGQIEQASIQESTGFTQLDQRLLQAIKAAKANPHIENKTTLPLIGYQVFSLKLKDETQTDCEYSFNSSHWQAQQQGQKTHFQYLKQPQLDLHPEQLHGHDRKVKFKMKLNREGQVKSVKIRQGSGRYEVDQQVIAALKGTEIRSKRLASTLWLYKPSSLKDEIEFKLDECH